jgi:hypothetical protein
MVIVQVGRMRCRGKVYFVRDRAESCGIKLGVNKVARRHFLLVGDKLRGACNNQQVQCLVV